MTRRLSLLLWFVLSPVPGLAEYRITRDHRGDLEQHKAAYARLRDAKEQVIIDGICNSACTLVLGIVPLQRVCATPLASLGFHEAYFGKRWTAGLRVTSVSGTEELMSIHPKPVKDWTKTHGGLSSRMKHIRNGSELWAIVDPCPEEY